METIYLNNRSASRLGSLSSSNSGGVNKKPQIDARIDHVKPLTVQPDSASEITVLSAILGIVRVEGELDLKR